MKTRENPTERATARQTMSRRALLGMGGGLLRPATAAAQVRTPVGPKPLVFQDAQLTLGRRVTYGLTPADVTWIYGAGYDGYLDQQLNPDTIDDSACDSRLAPFTTIPMPTSALYAQDANVVAQQLIESTILRATYSRRQLFERMVEFWADHLNTNINTVGIYKTGEVRDVYRKYALGTFPQMLNASAAGPAMIISLNNAQNSKSAPNQNYAREVMELHTLGVDGGYTQQDIVEVARCFTGWRYNGNTGTSLAGTFNFDSTQHDTKSKLVLGNTIAAGGGVSDGLKVLEILLGHPSTASFVSRKMLRWLLSYDPSPAQVADVAFVYTNTGGNIKEMVRRILSNDNLQAAPALFKRPFHYFVSAMRVLNVNVTTYSTIRSDLTSIGHQPFNWLAPNGYPQSFEYWGTLPLPRWNFVSNLAIGGISGVTVDTTPFTNGATTAKQVADRIDAAIFVGQMPAADKDALITFMKPDPPTLTRMRDGIGLALSSPAFQWH